jgi:hypothetical protein
VEKYRVQERRAIPKTRLIREAERLYGAMLKAQKVIGFSAPECQEAYEGVMAVRRMRTPHTPDLVRPARPERKRRTLW